VLNNRSVLECVCVASDEEWNGLGGSEVAFGERSQDNNGAFAQSDPESERDSNGTFSRFENKVSGNTSGMSSTLTGPRGCRFTQSQGQNDGENNTGIGSEFETLCHEL
jgi:hypothetical protein